MSPKDRKWPTCQISQYMEGEACKILAEKHSGDPWRVNGPEHPAQRNSWHSLTSQLPKCPYQHISHSISITPRVHIVYIWKYPTWSSHNCFICYRLFHGCAKHQIIRHTEQGQFGIWDLRQQQLSQLVGWKWTKVDENRWKWMKIFDNIWQYEPTLGAVVSVAVEAVVVVGHRALCVLPWDEACSWFEILV